MNNSVFQFLFLINLFLFCGACGPVGKVIDEEDDPSFEKGRSLLKVGRKEEALDEFLSISRRMVQCPKSHLECGTLLLNLETRKDPIAAIYHFRRFLLLSPKSRETSKVEQLIVTAEREIMRKLPGKPYENYLDSIKLKEENDKLKAQVEDMKARLGLPLGQETLGLPAVAKKSSRPILSSIPSAAVPHPPIQPTVRSYTVKPGDSLYAISRKIYGDSSHTERIFQANRDLMSSKNSLRVGQILRIPTL